MEVPKHKTYRNEDYKKFIRRPGEIIHHESSLPDAEKATGKKCSDYYGISMSDFCHKDRHNMGFFTFWKGQLFAEDENEVIIDLQRVVIKNLIAYIESKR